MKLDRGRPTTTLMDLKPSIMTPEQQQQHSQVNLIRELKIKKSKKDVKFKVIGLK